MRRVAAILVTLTLLLPAASLFAVKPASCCCPAKRSCPLQKRCGCSISKAMPHQASASIPLETRWTIETPFTVAGPQVGRSFPLPPALHARRIAAVPDTPPPRLS
ncbi:MAG TPA: hypothetical protein VJ276_26360, partial [Thermoanaerobaculia bacterium]|nr:hypothetical protein [Thermoanaerobaculia bacterium]